MLVAAYDGYFVASLVARWRQVDALRGQEMTITLCLKRAILQSMDIII